MTWYKYKIVIQLSPVLYRGISHLYSPGIDTRLKGRVFSEKMQVNHEIFLGTTLESGALLVYVEIVAQARTHITIDEKK